MLSYKYKENKAQKNLCWNCSKATKKVFVYQTPKLLNDTVNYVSYECLNCSKLRKKGDTNLLKKWKAYF